MNTYECVNFCIFLNGFYIFPALHNRENAPNILPTLIIIPYTDNYDKLFPYSVPILSAYGRTIEEKH